jgi:MOSC domain-containing protein YiiM
VSGRVEAIYLAAEHEGPPELREAVTAVPGGGLEGDRHFGQDAHDLTLIEAEAIEGMAADTGIDLPARDARRQVVTRGVSLNDLVGKRFRVGAIECVGEELCEPCRHLESLTQPGVLRGLVHRGGLCAEVLSRGEIAVGDPIETL